MGLEGFAGRAFQVCLRALVRALVRLVNIIAGCASGPSHQVCLRALVRGVVRGVPAGPRQHRYCSVPSGPGHGYYGVLRVLLLLWAKDLQI